MIPEKIIRDPQLKLWLHFGTWKGSGSQEKSQYGHVIVNHGAVLGADCMRFDGVDQYIDCGVTPDKMVGEAQGFTILLLSRQWMTVGTEYPFGANETVATGKFWILHAALLAKWGYGDKSSVGVKGITNADNMILVAVRYRTLDIDYGRINTQINTIDKASEQPLEDRDTSISNNVVLGALNNAGVVQDFAEIDVTDIMVYGRYMAQCEASRIYERIKYLR